MTGDTKPYEWITQHNENRSPAHMVTYQLEDVGLINLGIRKWLVTTRATMTCKTCGEQSTFEFEWTDRDQLNVISPELASWMHDND